MTIHRPERKAPARQREFKRNNSTLQIMASKAKIQAQINIQKGSK